VITGIAVSNPAEGMAVGLLCLFCLPAGNGLFDKLTTRSEESIRGVCLIVCDL
jgi:hypothetical protein